MKELAFRRALVVDDDPVIRQLLALVLEEIGLTVQCAASGEEGLERLDDFAPDFIITDLDMPGLSGLAFASEVRTRLAHTAPPIVLVSGNPSLARDERTIFAAVVRKPFGARAIFDAVERCLPA